MIGVLIVDDHPLFQTGLKRAFDFEDDIKVAGICDNGEAAIEEVAKLRPDVILLDVNLPGINGLQVARTLSTNHVNSAIIILTAHHDDEQILHALRSGAAAYCAKDVSPGKLIEIIREVAAGYYFADDKRMTYDAMQEWLNDQIESNANTYVDTEGHFVPLSPREMEILEHVTHGLINKEIATKLGISQQTVKNHMTSILKKLNVKDRTQAAVTALRRGWVRIEDKDQQEAEHD